MPLRLRYTLQEAHIAYTLPKNILGKARLTLGLTARNLWMIYNKAPFDPEVTASTGTYYQGFEEINNPKHLASAQQLAVDNYNVGSYMAQLQDQTFPEQENAYQMAHDLIGNYLGRYLTYTVAGWNGKSFATFNAPDGWVRWPFRQVTPKVLGSFNDVKRLASQGGANYQEDLNYNWALILRAYALLNLTDMYGPLPLGLDEKNPTRLVGTNKTDDNYARRAYKQTEHQVAFGWFSGWTGVGSSLQGSLAGLPDSVDFVSLWGGWKNPSQAQLEDLRFVQKVKGTRALVCFLLLDIGGQITSEMPKEKRGRLQSKGHYRPL